MVVFNEMKNELAILQEEKQQHEEKVTKMKEHLIELKEKFENDLQKEIDNKQKLLADQSSMIEDLERYHPKNNKGS